MTVEGIVIQLELSENESLAPLIAQGFLKPSKSPEVFKTYASSAGVSVERPDGGAKAFVLIRLSPEDNPELAVSDVFNDLVEAKLL